MRFAERIPEICQCHGVIMEEDEYNTSLVRRQAFRKEVADTAKS